MKVLILFILLILLSPAIVNAKIIELVSNFIYSNTSNTNSGKIFHRVTIPVTTINQRLIKIEINDLEYKIKKHQHSKESKYIEVIFDVPKQSKINKSIIFTLELKDYSFTLADTEALTEKEIIEQGLLNYISPSEYIESNSKQIKAIAKNLSKHIVSFKDKVKSSYEFVNDYLVFKKLPRRTSALTSLQQGYGDCTEYSDLFVAISRAMNIPARTVSLFNFKNKNTFSLPNHNEAEIFLKNHGWVIVYTNLGQGQYQTPYSLGNMTSDNVVYTTEKVWTWSNYFTKKRLVKNAINTQVEWHIFEK